MAEWSPAKKWWMGLLGVVAGSIAIALFFGAVNMRDTGRSTAADVTAMKLAFEREIGSLRGSVDTITAELKGRPRYDLNQAIAEAAAQAATDAAQNANAAQIAESLAQAADRLAAMDTRQIIFDERLRSLEARVNQIERTP